MARFCSQCGTEIPEGAEFCPKCGARVGGAATSNAKIVRPAEKSDRSRGIATILCALGFICVAGIHRFYVGRVGTGILWLLTGGLFGIGTIIDFVMLLTGDFTDINGLKVTDWDMDQYSFPLAN